MVCFAPTHHRPVLLLVEDHPHVAQCVRSLLEELGYECLQVETIADAQQQLTERHFDAVLADYQLPDGRGTDLFAQRLTPLPERRVLMSVEMNEYLREQGLEAGFHACLSKFDLTVEALSRAFRMPVSG